MEHRRFVKLREEPRRLEAAAAWFHQKWGIPQEAYRASMEACLTGQGVPQWYLAVEGERILGGLGVIANDFHPRRDLSPNVCAVYVEEDARCQGIAGALLGLACRTWPSWVPHFVPADGPHRLLRALRLEYLCPVRATARSGTAGCTSTGKQKNNQKNSRAFPGFYCISRPNLLQYRGGSLCAPPLFFAL